MSRRRGREKKGGTRDGKAQANRGERADGPGPIPPKMFILNPRFRGLSDNIRKRRAMERENRGLHRLIEGGKFQSVEELNSFIRPIMEAGGPPLELPENATPLEKAQDLAWKAMDTPVGKDRIRMAEEALDIYEDCTDSYVIIGNEAMVDGDLDKALILFEKGIMAGKRTLGEQMFRENVGRFWGILETRPYMRALLGLANTLRDMGRRGEAVKQYWEILRLNPDDNQGARYMLMDILLEDGLDEDAQRLIKEHGEEWTADWSYTKVLLEFRRHGDGTEARKALVQAMKANIFVPRFLLGIMEVPDSLPDCYETGGGEEAFCYVKAAMRAWTGTIGALDWLARSISALLQMQSKGMGRKDSMRWIMGAGTGKEEKTGPTSGEALSRGDE